MQAGAPFGHEGRFVGAGVGVGAGAAVGAAVSVGEGVARGAAVGASVAIGEGDGDGDALGDALGEGDGVAAGDAVGAGAAVTSGPISKPIDGSGENSRVSIVRRAVTASPSAGRGVAEGTTTFSFERSIVEIVSSPDAVSVPSAPRSTCSALPCFSPAPIAPRRLRLKLRLAPATADAVSAYGPPLPLGKTTKE